VRAESAQSHGQRQQYRGNCAPVHGGLRLKSLPQITQISLDIVSYYLDFLAFQSV
jgi:hypothetical protein